MVNHWLFRLGEQIGMICYLSMLLTGCGHQSLQLMHSAYELSSREEGSWVRSIREKPRSHQVVVVDKAGRKQVMPASSVWGYRTDRDKMYRFYQNGWYEVRQRGPLSVYRINEFAAESYWEHFFFSITPDGPIYDLNRRTLNTVFKDDVCMQRLLNRLREQQLLRTDGRGSFVLANAYLFCHGHDTIM